MTYTEETLNIASERSADIQKNFMEEVVRLLNSGALDKDNHNRGMLFGVALENIADNFLRGERNSRSYRNLKHF